MNDRTQELKVALYNTVAALNNYADFIPQGIDSTPDTRSQYNITLCIATELSKLCDNLTLENLIYSMRFLNLMIEQYEYELWSEKLIELLRIRLRVISGVIFRQ